MPPRELVERLNQYGQEHLVRHWNELSAAEHTALVDQLGVIDFSQIASLFRQAPAKEGQIERANRAEPPPAFRLGGSDNPFTSSEAKRCGEAALAAGQVGAVLVAGGQGTRLGFEHPKGMYPIGPVSASSLFQILVEKLLAVGRRYGATIPLYLMTSPATHDETREFFDCNHRFGLRHDQVEMFCQGTMPAVDAVTGRVLLDSPGHVFTSPDGHGGMLLALDRAGLITEMRTRGLKLLFYFQVDNPLVEVCDPVLIGYHLLSQSELSTQVVAKQHPTERVGNVVSIDGKVQIIEYSDLPDAVARQTNADGSLRLWAGNIAVHVFDLAFLERAAADDLSLPFHIARKIVPFVDDRGELITPTQPNAIKFERFIFDLLPRAERAIVMEIDGRRCFAPVKNGPGSDSDSPESVRRQMLALHREWLEAAGAVVDANAAVEISPLFALDSADVGRRVKPGESFARATYLSCPINPLSVTTSPCFTR